MVWQTPRNEATMKQAFGLKNLWKKFNEIKGDV